MRLDLGRLRRIDDRTEQAMVLFVLGTLGWNYVTSSKPELRFKLLGESQNVTREGLMELSEDDLKYGVLLMVPETVVDRRIFGTDLALMLNGHVVDRSFGAYVRSIKLSINLKQG